MTVVRIERGDERSVRGAALDRLAQALGTTADGLRREPDAEIAALERSGETSGSGQKPGEAAAS